MGYSPPGRKESDMTEQLSGQAPLSIGFSRQGYWSGLPFLSLEDLLNLGTEPESLVSPALQTVLYPLSHH